MRIEDMARPMLLRNDTEALLDYYESPLANKQPQRARSSSSSSSSSSSDYSSSDSEYSGGSPTTPSTTRRVHTSADAGDPMADTDVALVVPPDAAFTHHRSQSHAGDDEIHAELAPKRRSTGQSVPTPDIGDGKSIAAASPIVVSTYSGSYLSYQPGIHATAGPLPPPPMLDPHRKAQIDAVRKALELPPSVHAALSRKVLLLQQWTLISYFPISSHRREGAFSPSVDQARVSISESPPVPVISAPPENKKKRVSAELSISDPDIDEPIVLATPSPPPKSLRNSLTRGLHRMSLSRSPSVSSRTPSPPAPPPLRLPPPKIKALYPSAMYCPELHPATHASKMTSLERCQIYTQKINQLYVYDCGLQDWIVDARMRTRSSTISHGGPSIPSTKIFTPQPRHTSHGSEASEVTFPTRPDAGVATDLSSPSSSTAGAILPYPALPPRTSSMPKSGGFFSSLGRKASASRRGHAPASGLHMPISSSHPAQRGLLTKRPTISPSVPGGPRPPGGWKRISRSQTINISRGSESDAFSSDGHSMPPRVASPVQSEPDPVFEAQLDKLTVLIPQADRHVLAGYLRRAGQDLVAIGLYLDDEKNGRIRSN